MSSIRILSDSDVRSVLDMKQTLECVEKAYILKARKQARVFPMISTDITPGRAEMDIKSGMLDVENVFGMKLVSWFGDNPKQGLPAITGLTMLFDSTNGFPKGVLNAGYITGMRTGAAGALGVKYLAKQGSRVLFVMGTGGMAVFQIAATLTAVPTLSKVYIYDPLNYGSAEAFQHSIKSELGKIVNDFNDSDDTNWKHRIELVDFVATNKPAEALQESDAVITITPSRKPLIRKEWIRPGTHLSCVGADAEGKQEIDENIFDGARVFVDDREQTAAVGETQSAIRAGLIEKNSLTEIGDMIVGNASGRKSDQEITIFDSTGISLQDIIVANYALEKAEVLNSGFRHKNIGTKVEL